MSTVMDEKCVADYFVVAGLSKNPQPLEEFSFDGSSLKETYNQAPITDITVIFPSLGEAVPAGFVCVETTPTGLSADLNHGSIRSPEVYLCYRRSREHPPLVDLGVLYQGKERVMSDSEVLLSTPYGRPANVNNAGSHTYLTYRRAKDTAPCNQLVVTDVCVIVTSKGETPPHAYCVIPKNLNKSMLGSDVYLCYKKSMNKANSLDYKPEIECRYPLEDRTYFSLPESVPLFCLPMGATIECWPPKASTPPPVFSTFVLTVSDAAEKVYGSSITFYEPYDEEDLTPEQREMLRLDERPWETQGSTIHSNKSICILSHWPFFDTFKKFLKFLYKVSCTGPHPVPLERYVSHFLQEIPFPSAQLPRILIQLTPTERIALAHPEDLPIPRRGASFRQLLINLSPDNCLLLMLLALTEQKILIHSLRPDVLTATAEAVVTSIFPFKWQCPYIPLCPLSLSDVLNAPLPFLIGVDSRFFDLYDPPQDVSCVDLDTNTISICDEKKFLITKLLPKKAARNLRNSLQALREKIHTNIQSKGTQKDFDKQADISMDREFKIKKKELMLELEIQDAFLRFMASLLKGYRNYLLPITRAPTIGTTDPSSLFDLQSFLRSRDKAFVKFYSMVMKTQMFIRFIEERSFVSDMDSSLAFFDECTEKADLDDAEYRLLELDESHHSERTLFVMPPEPIDLPPDETYTYKCFGTLDTKLFAPLRVSVAQKQTGKAPSTLPPGSPMARRTKQEIKQSQKAARKHAETPMLWARCLLGTCFSLWYIHLPSHIASATNKPAALRAAYEVLVKMQKMRLHPADEVCYRALMQLCGAYSLPVLAVRVLFEMKRHGVQPNAITYGFYNKAVLEAKWPSDAASQSQMLWSKLRTVVHAAAVFRQGALHHKAVVDEVDKHSDILSRTSVDSVASHDSTHLTGGRPETPADKIINAAGSQTDMGYSSMSETHKASDSNSNPGKSDTPATCKNGVNGIGPVPTTSMVKRHAHKPSTGSTGSSAGTPSTALTPTGIGGGLDPRASEEFRLRLGSIVRSPVSRSSSDSLFHSALQSQAANSSAGLLMTSQLETSILDPTTVDQIKTAVLRAPPTPPSRRALKEKSETLPTRTSLFRSSSFSSDASMLSKLTGALSYWGTNEREGGATSATSSVDKSSEENGWLPQSVKRNASLSLGWVRESFRKRGGIEGVVLDGGRSQSYDSLRSVQEEDVGLSMTAGEPVSPPPRISTTETILPEPVASVSPSMGSDPLNATTYSPGSTQDCSPPPVAPLLLLPNDVNSPLYPVTSPLRTPVTQNDPLGALATPTFTSPTTQPSSAVKTHNNRVFLFPDEQVRLFRNAEATETDNCHGEYNCLNSSPSLQQQQQLDNQTFKTPSSSFVGSSLKLPFSRYSPGRFSLRKTEFRVGTQILENAISSLSPGNLSAKKAELLAGGFSSLKTAATSLTKKLDEIKGVIGQQYPPNKLGSSLLPGFEGDRNSLGVGDEDLAEPLGMPGQWLRRGSSSDIASQAGTESDYPTMRGAPSLTSLSTQLEKFLHTSSQKNPARRMPVALEVCLTSCSKCHNCQALLYDEEIMAGWTAEDSNLNTKCPHCKKWLVPLLTVSIRDFRTQPLSLVQASLTPGESWESIACSQGSLQSLNVAPNKKPTANVTQQPDEPKSAGSNHSNQEKGEEDEEHEKRQEEPEKPRVTSPVVLEPFTVPYLSPLVLRRELENVLEREGDVTLTQSKFVDEHPILYWNLVWFYERVGLHSYLPGLSLQSALSANNDQRQIHSSWASANYHNVHVRCKWDNPRLHEELGQPLYVTWQQGCSPTSPLINALTLTDRNCFNRAMLEQIVAGIRYNDLTNPLRLIAGELRKRRTKAGAIKHHGLYRELLFLSFVAIGRNNVDQVAFDREYRTAYDRLDPKCLQVLSKCDGPPSIASVFCRRFFRELEL